MAKTTPASVRFRTLHFNFVKEREGLNSPQNVVDFLLEDYFIRHKLIPEKLKEAKIITGQSPLAGVVVRDIQPEEPKAEPIKSFEYYREQKIACENEEDWEKLKQEILDSVNLSQKQKNLLTSNS